MWLFIGFIAAVFMLGRFTFIMDFWHHLPVLGSSRIPVRYHLWATMAAAALASQGVSLLISADKPLKIRRPLFFLGLLALAGSAIFIWGMIPWWTESARWTTSYHRDRNAWLTRELLISAARSFSLFLIALALVRASGRNQNIAFRSLTGYLIAAIVCIDLMASHWWDMPTVDPSFWTSPPAAVGIVKADPKAARVMGIAKYSAGEPGYASKPTDFFAPRDAIGWSLPLAYGLESNIGETPFRPERLIRLTNLAGGEAWRFSIEGVSHIVSGQPMNIGLKPVNAGTALVYRLPDPEPRFHWARSAQIISGSTAETGKAAEEEIQRRGAANTTDVVVIESPSNLPAAPASPPYPDAILTNGITPVMTDGDKMQFRLNPAEDAWLRLGVSFDPGWHATIDGKPATIYPAQLAYMALPVPKGEHLLEMHYLPANFRVGLAVTVLGTALGLLASLSYRGVAAGQEGDDPKPRTLLSPVQYLVVLAILLAVSAVGMNENGRPVLSSRWDDSWHRFTWGAGLEAMGR
jgi:hypothetical protein